MHVRLKVKKPVEAFVSDQVCSHKAKTGRSNKTGMVD